MKKFLNSSKICVLILVVFSVLFACEKKTDDVYDNENPDTVDNSFQPDTIPPTCKILFPSDGDTVYNGKLINIKIEAEDNLDSILFIIYFFDGAPLDNEDTTEFNFKFRDKSPGQYQLFAKVYDTGLNFAADSIMLTVPFIPLSVTTEEVQQIYSIKANIQYRIEYTNSDEIEMVGLCWNDLGNPTRDNIWNGHSFGDLTGIRLGEIPYLRPNKQYYTRAYAELKSGEIIYGNELSFKTMQQGKGVFTDSRDSQEYETIELNNKTWMAENLNYYTDAGSWYYNNDSLANSEIYGRLYTRTVAKNSCPSGWHLPSRNEWNSLITFLGGDLLFPGGQLKDTLLWQHPNTRALNNTGFSGRPAGVLNGNGSFVEKGRTAHFWTSSYTVGSSNTIYDYKVLDYDDYYVGEGSYSMPIGIQPTSGFSVRCVKDN